MKHLLCTICLSISLVSCFPIKNITGDCKADAESVFAAITPLLYEEKFEIKTSDAKNGFLLAEIPPMANTRTGNGTIKWVWRVTIRDGRVLAESKMVQQVNNVYGAPQGTVETYADDDAGQDMQWYWKIRNKLQQMCGSALVVTTKD